MILFAGVLAQFETFDIDLTIVVGSGLVIASAVSTSKMYTHIFVQNHPNLLVKLGHKFHFEFFTSRLAYISVFLKMGMPWDARKSSIKTIPISEHPSC